MNSLCRKKHNHAMILLIFSLILVLCNVSSSSVPAGAGSGGFDSARYATARRNISDSERGSSVPAATSAPAAMAAIEPISQQANGISTQYANHHHQQQQQQQQSSGMHHAPLSGANARTAHANQQYAPSHASHPYQQPYQQPLQPAHQQQYQQQQQQQQLQQQQNQYYGQSQQHPSQYAQPPTDQHGYSYPPPTHYPADQHGSHCSSSGSSSGSSYAYPPHYPAAYPSPATNFGSVLHRWRDQLVSAADHFRHRLQEGLSQQPTAQQQQQQFFNQPQDYHSNSNGNSNSHSQNLDQGHDQWYADQHHPSNALAEDKEDSFASRATHRMRNMFSRMRSALATGGADSSADAAAETDTNQQHQLQSHQQQRVWSTEPSLQIVGDNIVLVLKPQEFNRKRLEFIRGGPHNMQVFTDFESVLTHSRVATATTENSRVITTAEAVECSGLLPKQTMDELSAATKALQLSTSNSNSNNNRNEQQQHKNEDELFTAFTVRCQQLLTSSGALRKDHIPILTARAIDAMPLREGWQRVLAMLTEQQTPAFIFSSGYGDIVHEMLTSPRTGSLWSSEGILPSNIRIISNFFRYSPDGTVRGFSSPVIHDCNKNASTIARFMGFDVPNRPNSLVIAASEEDVNMSSGVTGEKERLSIGYLDISDDVMSKLPAFLQAFDAVVLNDGSFEYIRRVVQDLLQVPEPVPATQRVVNKLSSFIDKIDIF